MKLQGLNLEEGYDNLMQDTIQIDNKTIEWLLYKEGLRYPFNFVTEKESVKGRAGSIAKARYLNDIEFELPLIIRNEALSPGGQKSMTIYWKS